MRALAALALAALPAAVLYLAWRRYVLTHMPQGEIAFLPIAQWRLGAVGLVLLNMLRIMAGKGLFYAVLLAAIAAALRRRGRDPAGRLGIMLAGCFVLYSAALVLAYIAAFPGTMGSDAHSYFRYSTASFAAADGGRPAAAARAARAGGVGAVRAGAADRGHAGHSGGVPAAPPLRIEPPALRVWLLAQNAARFLPQHGRVALVLPGDNGSVAAILETVLRTAPPRRPELISRRCR